MANITKQPQQTVCTTSCKQELESLLNTTGIDWSGMLLGKSSNYNQEIPIIIQGSELHNELIRSIAEIENLLQPSGPEQILTELAKLRLHYPNLNLNLKESEILLTDYITDLSQYPIDLIRQSCVGYRKEASNQFFPKIGQLIQILTDSYHQRRVAACEDAEAA